MTTNANRTLDETVRSLVSALVRRAEPPPEDFLSSQVMQVSTLTRDEAKSYLGIRDSFARESEQRSKYRTK
jgi:hypothetical protein